MSLTPSANNDPKTLVSCQWLADHLSDPDLRILDASWFMPGSPRDARAEYDERHIPGARFFDIDEIADLRSNMPHTVAPIEKFISRVRALGIGDGQPVVIYDSTGIFSAPRVWWNFRLMGKENVAVLDGGLPKWLALKLPTEDKPTVIRDRHLTVSRQNHLIKDVTQVAQAIKLNQAVVVDARSAARFTGEAPEPREGLRSGHIPSARNVPFGQLLNVDGTMKSPAELRRCFEQAGVALERPIITSCGSGVTAAILALALERIGHRDWALYDGSWTEWGMYEDLPIATGPACDRGV